MKIKYLSFILVILVILVITCESLLNVKGKKGSFLNLFTVVKFVNEACNTTITNKTGVCYTKPECAFQNGIPLGSCADGFGVCCFSEISCDGKSANNGTYFVNPNSPSSYNEARTCQVTIRKTNRNVCQFRLDFLLFRLHPPIEGTCSMDRFVVSGQSQNSIVPPICGTNNGQHFYIEVAGTEGSITLSVITMGNYDRHFDIKVTQIPCSSSNKAPANCLQYHTGVQGNIKSFNYNFDPRLSQIQNNQPIQNVEGYFNNLDYALCFRKEVGFCSISYTVANTTIPTTGTNLPSTSFAIRQGQGQTPGTAGAGPTECTTDYLILANTRFCNGRLHPDLAGTPSTNEEVVDMTSGPFIARFVTDAMYTDRGFDLNYRQNPCTTAGR